MDNNISFSKIVATPTLNSWSQAYNAGKLFAALSLEKTQELNEDAESLNVFGKDLLERLEQEFFTIEDKNLESIKNAILNTFKTQQEQIIYSFASCVVIKNILYLFSLGKGKVFIKREGNFGLVLDSSSDYQNVTASSGFLKEADLIVLTTDSFAEVVSNDELNSSLDDSLPSEIAETLAPKIHKAENGKISAIIIKYGQPQADPPDTQDDLPASARQWQAGLGESLRAGEIIDEGIAINEPAEVIQEKGKFEKSTSPFIKYLLLLKSILRKPNLGINHKRKVFLSVAVAIVGILIFSIFFTIQKQNNAKIQALFAQIYPQATKKYDEGQGLTDLNRSLARDAFVSAQKILQNNQAKFPAKSKETLQIKDLLQKIDEGLSQVSPVDKSGLDRSKLSIIIQNGSGKEGAAGKAGAILKELGYNVVSTGNADNYNYQGITIKVKKENSKFIDLLKKDLAKDYTVTSTFSDLSPDSSTSALIIIGK